MPEPSIPELLRWGFEIAQEPIGFRLYWPVDIDGQARCIRHLADMVKNEAWSTSVRQQAFDELKRIARDYRAKGQTGSVPLEMFSFAFAVFTGEVERPKRKRGERRSANAMRDGLIVRGVAWLVFDRGESEADAIEMIREAIPRAGGGELTAERIRDIIAECGPIEKYRNQMAAFDSA